MIAFLVSILSVVSLCGSWQLRCNSPQGDWIPVEVPGCVHTDLLAQGLIDDPFYADNEKRLQWIGEKDWEYSRTFVLTAEELSASHAELVLEGVDTYSKIYVNGTEVLATDNMFRTWRVDVKALLYEGENTIRVCFDSVFKTDMPKYLNAPYKLQAWPNNDQSSIWLSLYARKAGYNYGWDWGPRFITTGLWKPVYLDCWSGLELQPSQILTVSADAGKARMNARVSVKSDFAGPVCVSIVSDGKVLYRKNHDLAAGENIIDCPFTVKNPRLWWSNGLGGQPLYDFRIVVGEGEKKVSRTERTGIRTIEVVREKDEWGTSMYVKLNGTPVFCKGADWVPQDNFPARISRERMVSAVKDAADANMNMLRVWGGGLYESEDFYNACDSLGILIWQDVAFACGMFPSDEAYLRTVAEEVKDNVRRLRNHPSLALWCGNNENEISYYEWGWNRTLSPAQREDYESGLKRLFYQTIPQAIASEDASRYYHPSSPVTGYSGIAYSEGDAHYWGVWKGAWIEEYLKPQNIARFMSEYGFQSYPCMETIHSFCPDWDLYVGSNSLIAHQKAHDDNTRDPYFGDKQMRKYMQRYFHVPSDLEDFVFLSQFMQAEAVKVAMEAHRRAKPYCMGTLFWQLNDCWPVASWSSVDYYGNWKPLQYYAKRSYSEVLASPYIAEDGKIRVKVVSDRKKKLDATLEFRIMDADGTLHDNASVSVSAPADACMDAFAYDPDVPASAFVYVRLMEKGKVLSENTFFPLDANRYSYAEAKPEIKARERNGVYLLEITSPVLIRCLMLSAPGVVFEDNCLDIVPGVVSSVVARTEKDIDTLLSEIEYSSLNTIR